jgi:hypothetical protein
LKVFWARSPAPACSAKVVLSMERIVTVAARRV